MKLDTLHLAPETGTMPTEDEWAEADMLADQVAGVPLARTPEEGIKWMDRRIRHLESRIQNCVDDSQLSILNSQLREAHQRLAEYRAQLGGRN